MTDDLSIHSLHPSLRLRKDLSAFGRMDGRMVDGLTDGCMERRMDE